MTNYSQGLALTPPISGRHEEGLGPMSWLLTRLSQLICGWRGHTQVLHFENTRVQLVCTSCSYTSPGWDVGHTRPRLTHTGDARRHTLLAPARATAPVPVRKIA